MSTVTLAENFAQNLRETLIRRGVSQSELSRRSGVTNAAISNILSGKMEPSLTMCEKLAAALDIRADLALVEPQKKPA